MSKLAKLAPMMTTVCGVLILIFSVLLWMERNEWREKYNKTFAELTKTQGDLAAMTTDRNKWKKDYEETFAKLTSTEATLKTTSEQLAAETERATKLDTDLKDLTSKHEAQTQELASTNDKLAAAQKSVEELTAKTASLTDQVTTLTATKAANEEKIKFLDSELKRLKGIDVALPKDLRPKVMAVDKTWNFVVLSSGKLQGALPGGSLIVSRDGKSIGTVKIVTVHDDKSIADVTGVTDPKVLIQVGDDCLPKHTEE